MENRQCYLRFRANSLYSKPTIPTGRWRIDTNKENKKILLIECEYNDYKVEEVKRKLFGIIPGAPRYDVHYYKNTVFIAEDHLELEYVSIQGAVNECRREQ